jgi:DNA-binding transcriptional LysR family regulator
MAIISAMSHVHFRAKDLNLLVVFDALMVERNMTKAARRLGLTQSAVSHALRRLRRDLGDDLLVRGAKGMVPTRRALELRSGLSTLVRDLEAFYRFDAALDLQRVEARLTVSTTDYVEAIVFPRLLAILRAEAPGVTVVSRPTAGSLPRAELETGAIDVAIAGYFADVPEGFFVQRLCTDHFRTAVRRGHPRLQNGRLSIAAYAAAEHVLISPQGDLKARMDDELAKRGHARRIVAGLSSFLSSAWIVAESDYVLTALARDLEAFARYFPLVVFETPIALPPVHLAQVWHERTHRSALHRWFRSAVERAARPEDAGPTVKAADRRRRRR